jgi:hypothetical protein
LDVSGFAECESVDNGAGLRRSRALAAEVEPEGVSLARPAISDPRLRLQRAATGFFGYLVGTTGVVSEGVVLAAELVRAAFTAGEILSALARSWLTCQS